MQKGSSMLISIVPIPQPWPIVQYIRGPCCRLWLLPAIMNFNNTPLNHSQPIGNPGHPTLRPLPVRSAFLLGQGPLPLPTGPEVAAALAMRRINHQGVHHSPPVQDKNIDPQLLEAAQNASESTPFVKALFAHSSHHQYHESGSGFLLTQHLTMILTFPSM